MHRTITAAAASRTRAIDLDDPLPNRAEKSHSSIIAGSLGVREMMTAVFVAALLQSAAINSQRDAYLACLKTNFETAKTQKMPPASFEAFLRQNCAAIETTFQASLIAFDVKNKVPRKQAASDAKLQVDDFIASSVERYEIMNTPKPTPAPPQSRPERG